MKDRKKNHHYFMNIECRDASGEVVYSHKEDPERDSCGLEDGEDQGPRVRITNDNSLKEDEYIDHPYTNAADGNTPEKYPKMWVIVEDVNTTGAAAIGLRPGHQKLRYTWYKTTKSGTTAIDSDKIDVKVKDYYASTGKGHIPIPKADMQKVEPDARYSLKVYGVVEDMNGNKTTTTEENTTWKPEDYPPSSVGYEVEKQSKCPALTFTSGGSAASTENVRWYNTKRDAVTLTITETPTIVARFDANKYNLRSAHRSNSGNFGSYSDFKSLDGETQDVSLGKNKNGDYINRIEKYTIEYQKKDGTTWYKCGESNQYGFDHDQPTLTYNFTHGTYASSTAVNSSYQYKGYQNWVQVYSTCSDSTSPTTFKDGSSNISSPYTRKETSRGKHTYDIKCIDKANNTESDGGTYRIITESATCGICAIKTRKYYEDCDNCGSYTYDCNCVTYYQCISESGVLAYECNTPGCNDGCMMGRRGTRTKCDTCTGCNACRTNHECETAYSCWY